MQEPLGHASLGTTTVYTKAKADRQFLSVEALFSAALVPFESDDAFDRRVDDLLVAIALPPSSIVARRRVRRGRSSPASTGRRQRRRFYQRGNDGYCGDRLGQTLTYLTR
ncbi:hypothetical protein [Burkholderia pseudomallei]|uniref:hypothetical protein n=1 Tax=Burkholderia pseudomallei TaxID=28450 RepID=UPI0020B72851|nr:hypothetical protein [Burkholderia pseudomallei]